MADRQLDTATGDLIDAPGGKWASTDAIDNKVLFSYSIPLGTWEGDPLLGHRFRELARTTDTPETRRRALDLIKEPVHWLIDSGELERVEADLWLYARGIYAFEVDLYQPGSTQPITSGPFFIAFGQKS
jgi:phage gp46-like protein